MTTAAIPSGNHPAGPLKWSELKIILVFGAVFWLGTQTAHIIYGILQEEPAAAIVDISIRRWLSEATNPADLAAIAIGAGLSFFIYLTLKRVRRYALWAQIVTATVATLAGSACFSLGCILIISWFGKEIPPNYFSLVAIRWVPSFGLWAGIALTVTYNFEARARERRLALAETQAREAQVQALRYQVNPHLLYNTLNSIAALILDNQNEVAEEMVLRLSDLFRASLAKPPHSSVPLIDEIAFQQLYLTIEKLRFGDRLTYEFKVDRDVEQVRVPSLILQPLIENALKHGNNPDGGATSLVVTATRCGNEMLLDVSNNAKGASAKSGLGIGLNNVRNRLQSHFGSAAKFEAGSHDRGFSVRMTIPAAAPSTPPRNLM